MPILNTDYKVTVKGTVHWMSTSNLEVFVLRDFFEIPCSSPKFFLLYVLLFPCITNLSTVAFTKDLDIFEKEERQTFLISIFCERTVY